MNRYLMPLVGFIILAVFLGVGLNLDPKKIPSPLVDKPTPAFSLPSLYQLESSVSTDALLGEIWLLNVFASWCAACKQEHPLISQLSKQNIITLVGLNYKDQRQDGLNWLGQFGDPYQQIAFDLAGDVGIDYGVYGVPESFLIDKKGHIRFKQIGPFTPEDIETLLLPMIAKLKAET